MEERIKATVLGNCIGDAMGIIADHFTKSEAQQSYGSFRGEMTYNLRQMLGARSDFPPGHWTESSDLMVLIIKSLVFMRGQVSGVSYGDLIKDWYNRGMFRDVPLPGPGRTIMQVIKHPAFMNHPHKAAEDVWEKTGCSHASNGAVMKTAVLGLYMFDDMDIVLYNAVKICKVTHADPRCQASCVAVATAVASMMKKTPATEDEMEKLITSCYTAAADRLKELQFEQFITELKTHMYTTDLSTLDLDNPDTGSYTFTTLAVAFWALRQQDFREAIEAIVLEGGNASANASLAGALLGCKLGLQAIPTPWMEQLLKKDWLEDKIKLYTRMIKAPPSGAVAYYKQQLGREEEPASPQRKYESLDSVCDPMQLNILAVLYGHAIGDAIGLLSEFLTKPEAEQCFGKYKGKLAYNLKELVNDRHRKAWLVGDWTDDTDQMVVIMESIIYTEGQVNVVDIAKRLKSWACYGFKELGDKGGNGLGATTRNVLFREDYEVDPIGAAQKYWELTGSVDAPNGAVMRTSVLGVFMYQDIAAVIRNATRVCSVTHADPRCQASCVAVATAIAMMLQKKPENDEQLENLIKRSYEYAKETLEKLKATEHLNDLKKYMYAASLKDLQLAVGNSIGYTFKCLGAGFWALRQDDYRTALEAIVFEAGDADTNGAVAGALLGCKLGFKGLPQQWLDDLRYRKWLDDIIEQFLILLQIKERAEPGSSAEGTGTAAGGKQKYTLRSQASKHPSATATASPEEQEDDLANINSTAAKPES